MVIAYAAIYTSVGIAGVLLLFLSGFLLFTFIEYLVHRYFFHIEPTTPQREKMQYMFHGVHHEYPRDKKRLAMPMLLSITLAVVSLLFFTFLMGDSGLPFDAGFMSGYASYLLVHYLVHTFRPPKNAFRILWEHHNLHHYKHPDLAFGVSSPLWDLVFGTMPPRKEKVN